MQENIRYLKETERVYTRSLYEKCFPEDSEEFVDYYYQEKIRDNEILVMEGPDGAERIEGEWPQVMLHFNPFLFQFGRETCSLNYIVAVATAPAFRHRGKMFRCMEWALGDMAAQGQPFTFLIPADPGIYRSSGFAFVPEPEGKCGGVFPVESDRADEAMEEGEDGRFTVRPVRRLEFPGLVDYANHLLERQYQVFPLWSQRYGERLMKELAAQEGGLLAAFDGEGSLKGIVTYGREGEEAELQHILSEPEDRQGIKKSVKGYLQGEGILKVSEAEMPFMVRILDLSRLMELMGKACGQSFRLRVRLKDEIIKENNGCFELFCREGTGGMCKISQAEVEEEMDIAGLVEYLFRKIRMYIREWV